LVGYAPQDDALEELPHLRDLGVRETVNAHNQSDEGRESGLRDDV